MNRFTLMTRVKKALINATIYFAVVCAAYFLILLSAEWFGFYALLLFYMIHFIGLLLIRPFYVHTVNSSRLEGHLIDVLLITINAAVVFLNTWLWQLTIKSRISDRLPKSQSAVSRVQDGEER
jgi:hypothetical protein